MDRLAQVVSFVVAALLLVAVAINFSNVFGRYVLDQPFNWADEALGYLQIGFVVIGAALVTRRNAHLRMDALEYVLPARVKRWFELLAATLMFAVALVVTLMSVRIVMGLIENETRTVATDIPLAIPYGAFPLGFALIALYALLRVVTLARGRQ